MGLRSTLFIAKNLLPLTIAETSSTTRVMFEHPHSRFESITGALLYADDYLAQVLEGQNADVAALVAQTTASHCQAEYRLAQDMMLEHRRFTQWSITYAGASLYVARMVARAMDEALHGSGPAAATLVKLMREFSAQHQRSTAGTSR